MEFGFLFLTPPFCGANAAARALSPLGDAGAYFAPPFCGANAAARALSPLGNTGAASAIARALLAQYAFAVGSAQDRADGRVACDALFYSLRLQIYRLKFKY